MVERKFVPSWRGNGSVNWITDFAFTPGVKEAQEHYGSRKNYERMEGDPDRYLW